MTKTQIRHGSQYSNGWHINKPLLVKPKVGKKVSIDGIFYYKGKNGKLYICELFDKMFKTVKSKILPKKVNKA